MQFGCVIGFVAFYAILLCNRLCPDIRTFVWRKIELKIAYVEKNYKYQVCTESENVRRKKNRKSKLDRLRKSRDLWKIDIIVRYSQHVV